MERQLPKPVPDREQRTVVWQLLQNLTVFRKIFAIRCELRQLQMAAMKRRRGEGEEREGVCGECCHVLPKVTDNSS